MRNDGAHVVRVVDNLEIKAPALAYPRLLAVFSLVIFLGSERWMVKVFFEELDLFEKRLSDGRRHIRN